MVQHSESDQIQRRQETADINRRLADGSESVAWELDEQFRQRLCVLVDRKMNEIYKRRQDPEDVVQSVLNSFSSFPVVIRC